MAPAPASTSADSAATAAMPRVTREAMERPLT